MAKRDAVRRVFKKAIEERFDDGQQLAELLEMHCHLASKKNYEKYLTLSAVLITHISPRFYTGRHSLIFRDLLMKQMEDLDEITGDLLADANNFALQDPKYLWPEIYDNPYLIQSDFKLITETRSVEISLVRNALLNGSKLPFEKALSDSVKKVCMNKGQECWSRTETEVVIPCTSGESCPISFCMPYEDFLLHFASDGMLSDVWDPATIEQENPEVLDSRTTEKLRKLWFKELCMARVYLEIKR